jgi:S1-C subfamily serine protease
MMLLRGQRSPLPAGVDGPELELRCAVEGPPASDLRLLILMLDAHDKLVEGRIVEANGARGLTGVQPVAHPPGFKLELRRLPATVDRLVLVLATTEAARARGLSARALRASRATLHQNGQQLVDFAFSSADFGDETALLLLQIYRKDGWRIWARCAGFVGGLPSLVAQFGGGPGDLGGGGGPMPSPRPSPSPSPTPAPRGAGPRMSPTPAGPLLLPSHYAGQQSPAVPADLTRAIGVVVVDLGDRQATGTGWMVSPGGLFLTCAHVIEGAEAVHFVGEGSEQPREAAVLHVDVEGDLALLHTTDHLGSPDWMLLALPSETPRLGDEVGLLGYPLGGQLGHNLTYSQGVVNSVRKRENRDVLQLDAGAAPGSSGGPVFRRRDGRVVGVLTSGLADGPGGMLINFAIDVRRCYQLGWFR